MGSAGTAPLVVDIRLGGSVHATANAAGDALTLTRSDGSTVWTYSGLEVYDAAGRSLPTHLAVQSSGGHDDLVIQVDDVGARYPLTIDPFVQQAKLTVSDGAAVDLLGFSVAISSDGSTLAAGASGVNSSQGAVYVFAKPSTGWANATQTAKLTASDGAARDALGSSVALSSDGSTVAAGAPDEATVGENIEQGAVYVFGPALPTLSPSALSTDATYGTNYLQALTATEPGYTGSFTYSSIGLPSWLTLSSTPSGETLSGTPNAVGPFTFTISATDSNKGTDSHTYTLKVDPASLSTTAFNFTATAGAPFSGTVATFTNVSPNSSAYTAVIDWGDSSGKSTVTINFNGSGNISLTVTGAHTYALAKSYTVTVTLSNPNVLTTTVTDTASVTSLGQGVVQGLTGGIGFWHNKNGQALLNSFGSTATDLTLANWLALTFPNLYGASAGTTNNLTGDSNAQVAAYFAMLFSLGGSQVQAQVLATALNVYATTLSLGGTAGVADGFSVSATGLGARSYNVGSDGAAFGVANNTMLNVYRLLLAVNQAAQNGLRDNGNSMLQAEAAALFNALNTAGSIG